MILRLINGSENSEAIMIKSRKWVYRRKDGSNVSGDIMFGQPITEEEVRKRVPFRAYIQQGPHKIAVPVEVDLIPFEDMLTPNQRKLRDFMKSDINKWYTVNELEELSGVGTEVRNTLDMLYHNGYLFKTDKVDGSIITCFFKYKGEATEVESKSVKKRKAVQKRSRRSRMK